MRVLMIGGTGLISTGIVKHLLQRNAEVTVFNRGKRASTLPAQVKELHGDRDDPAVMKSLLKSSGPYDVIIDMICFRPEQAQMDVAVFAGQCGHFIFCSTVCTYGIKLPPQILIDETFQQEPISQYGQDKVACERLLLQAHETKQLSVTIIRPSSTYGPGSLLIDNLESNAVAWDRIERGLPVLCTGDGLGLWVATHRDDCGKLFAYAAMNGKTFGESYNATRDEQFTWREYYRQAAEAIGKPAHVLFVPAQRVIRRDPARFGLLREITQFHGAYSSAKAKRDVPEFDCQIGFVQGASDTLNDARRRNQWRSSEGDTVYQAIVDEAIAGGIEPITV